jgi:hypothetical protein
MGDVKSVPKNIAALLEEHDVAGRAKTKREVLDALFKMQPAVQHMQEALTPLSIEQRVALFQQQAGFTRRYSLNLIALMCIAGARRRLHRAYEFVKQRAPWRVHQRGL